MDNASRNKRRAQLSVLTGRNSRSPSPSSASPPHKPRDGEAARTLNDALDEKVGQKVRQASSDNKMLAPPLPAAPKPAESPLFSGDFGPVDESLGLHLSSDTLTLPPSPAKREKSQHKSTNPTGTGTGSTDEDDLDDSDFEYGLDSAKSAQSFQVRQALGNRVRTYYRYLPHMLCLASSTCCCRSWRFLT